MFYNVYQFVYDIRINIIPRAHNIISFNTRDEGELAAIKFILKYELPRCFDKYLGCFEMSDIPEEYLSMKQYSFDPSNEINSIKFSLFRDQEFKEKYQYEALTPEDRKNISKNNEFKINSGLSIYDPEPRDGWKK